MSSPRLLLLLPVPLGATVVGACGRSKPASLAIGSTAPSFSLQGADGRVHSLGEYSNSPVLVVVFTCNHCPASQLYEQRIQKLYSDYRARGVTVVAVNPDSPSTLNTADLAYSDVPDSPEGMRARAIHRRLEYPYLYDGDGQLVATAFKVTALPQAFVFDAQRTLRYAGRIDDHLEPAKVTTQDLRAAIEALLANQPVKVATTEPRGCPMKWRTDGTQASPSDGELAPDKVQLQPIGPAGLKALRMNGTPHLMMVNFWATWCAPCIVEFPELQKVYQNYRSRNLGFVTVSVDSPEAMPGVLKLLRENHSSSRNHLFDSDDTARLQDSFDPALPAAVPFTLLLAPNGDVVHQQLGEAEFLSLRRAILANLPDDPKYPGLQAYWAGSGPGTN